LSVSLKLFSRSEFTNISVFLSTKEYETRFSF
jgi:hypothetical protein